MHTHTVQSGKANRGEPEMCATESERLTLAAEHDHSTACVAAWPISLYTEPIDHIQSIILIKLLYIHGHTNNGDDLLFAIILILSILLIN